jgi:hypothetical protein
MTLCRPALLLRLLLLLWLLHTSLGSTRGRPQQLLQRHRLWLAGSQLG